MFWNPDKTLLIVILLLKLKLHHDCLHHFYRRINEKLIKANKKYRPRKNKSQLTSLGETDGESRETRGA